MTKKINLETGKRILKPKMEAFCLKYCELGNATQAALAVGYASAYAKQNSGKLMNNPKILARIAELRQTAEDATIATVTEIERTLTGVLRTTPADVLIVSDDGRDLTIDKDALKSPGVSSIRIEQVALGKMPVRITRVSIADKIRAADLLCKMKGVYAPETKNVYNDIRILVVREETKQIKGAPEGKED